MFEKRIREISRKELGEVKKISKIGRGENHLMYLVRTDKGDFVFRIGVQKWSGKTMPREYEKLSMVPKGFAPRPIMFNKSGGSIGHPYMIITYIEGKTEKRWGARQLDAHARTLAALHNSSSFSYVQRSGRKRQSRFDILKIFDEEMEEMEQVRLPIIQKYLSRTREYFALHQDIFSGLSSYCLVHNDLTWENIIFNGEEVGYIDWEWSMIGDPAADIAILHPDVSDFPGSKAKFERFMAAYLNHRSDANLSLRVEVFVVKSIFNNLVYWANRYYFHDESAAKSKSNYQRCVRECARALDKFLDLQ